MLNSWATKAKTSQKLSYSHLFVCAFCASLWLKQAASRSFEEAAFHRSEKLKLIFVVAQQSALLKILAAYTMPGPRYCIEAFFRQHFPAVNTLPVTCGLDPFQRFIDQIEQLAIVV